MKVMQIRDRSSSRSRPRVHQKSWLQQLAEQKAVVLKSLHHHAHDERYCTQSHHNIHRLANFTISLAVFGLASTTRWTSRVNSFVAATFMPRSCCETKASTHGCTHGCQCQMFSLMEVDIGQPKAKGRQARCGVGETSALILSWGLCCCTKGSTGCGTPIGATRPRETGFGSQPSAA